MKNILKKLSKEKLIDFIMEYAENDTKFANVVNVRFGEPEFEKELRKIEKIIGNVLDSASDYRSRGDWGYISVDTSSIVAEINQRAEQGHIRLAFAETEMLYRKLLENFEYQEECEISDEAEYCLSLMSEIADKAVLDEDKKYIYQSCIVLSELEDGKDYGADYEDKLLGISAKFVTQENRSELESALANFDSGWREEEFKLIRVEVIRNIEGENAANEFISENLQFSKIREIAFETAITCKNFEEAEQLCIGALSDYAQHYGISPWLYKLYSVFEMTGNTEKMAETAEKILLCGNLEYYDKLKTLLNKQRVWDVSYSELLCKCESRLSHSQYMEILAKEKEYNLLFEQVKKHTEMIYHYGKLLAGKYPIDVCAVFTKQIYKDAEAAYGRESYSKVCTHISCFAGVGYKDESSEMIRSFKLKYKRKPAFVDELSKIRPLA